MIKVALFGFGRIGQMHARNLTKNKEIKLLYVYEKLINYVIKQKNFMDAKLKKIIIRFSVIKKLI